MAFLQIIYPIKCKRKTNYSWNVLNNFFIICVNILWISSVTYGSDAENNLNIKISNHGFELTQANNLQRQELVQSVCDSYLTLNSGESSTSSIMTPEALLQPNHIPDDQLEHLLIDEKHKFLYCYVPKVRF